MTTITISVTKWIALGLVAFISVVINLIIGFKYLLDKYPVFTEEVKEESVKEHELKENIFKAYKIGFNLGYKKGIENYAK